MLFSLKESSLTELVLALNKITSPLEGFFKTINENAWKMKVKSISVTSLKDLDHTVGQLERTLTERLAGFEYELYQSYVDTMINIKEIQEKESNLLAQCNSLMARASALLTHEASLRIHITHQIESVRI